MIIVGKNNLIEINVLAKMLMCISIQHVSFANSKLNQKKEITNVKSLK
jgi:hypothetical protein